jgi:hypothetical protein
MKSILAALGAAVALVACTAPSQPMLDQAIAACTRNYNDRACVMVPYLQHQVAIEQQQQANTAAAVALGLGAVALGAAEAYSASQPQVVYVRSCRWRYC